MIPVYLRCFNLKRSVLVSCEVPWAWYSTTIPAPVTSLPGIKIIESYILRFTGLKRLKQSQKRRMAQKHSLSSHVPRGSVHSRNLNEVNMTKIAILIVVTFVLLNMLRLILGFFDVAHMFTIMKCFKAKVKFMRNINQYVADEVARLLMVVNSSVNFLIYCCFSNNFQVCKYRPWNILSNIPCWQHTANRWCCTKRSIANCPGELPAR